MLDVKIEGLENVKKKFAVYLKETRKEAGDMVLEIAGLSCKYISDRTFPVGVKGSKKSGKKGVSVLSAGEAAVNKDVRKTFISSYKVGDLLWRAGRKREACGFRALVKEGRLGEAYAIASSCLAQLEGIKPTPTIAHLQSRRGGDGHAGVNSDTIITMRGALSEFKVEAFSNVGLAKSVWIKAGKALSTSIRLAKWITKRTINPIINKVAWNTNPEVIVHNPVKYASATIAPDQIKSSIVAAFKAKIKSWSKAQEYITNKANK